MTPDYWGPIPKIDREKWERENRKPPPGGARPGAGRPRTANLSAAECLRLADLLDQQQESSQDDTATADKLRRMAARIERTGR